MSRCFPFPPPGYEKKARSDHTNLSTKEKHKEKKHKKEKRDKEKKEGKERKDKDRSKDKHKEKEDRKERQRDKKRDKDKDKDKSRTLDDRRIVERTEGHNEQKLGVRIQNAEEVKDYRFTEESGRRIRDEEEGAAANIMFENITCSIPKRVEGLGTATPMEKERGNGNGMVANLISKEQRRIDGIERPVEKDAVKKIEEEASNDREAGDGNGDRLKDRDREEKKNKEKDRNRHKEKDKIKEKGEHKHKELDETKDTGKRDQVDSINLKSISPHNANAKCAGTDGHNKKRKDFEMNGFLHENDVRRPNKLPRPASSSHPPGENGRTLELRHVPIPHSSIRHGTMNNIKAERVLDDKEHKINGTAVAQRPSVAASANVKSEASSKPRHRDSKHLSQMCSVPKMEEWPESDDQEWLFSGGNSQPKSKALFEAGEAPQVWAKGLQIEPADAFALPYVIPY